MTEMHRGLIAGGAAVKGRGTSCNPGSRFQPLRSELDEHRTDIATEVRQVRARSAISRNTSPDLPFEQSINPYQGCEHGCVYCYARPSHAYHDLSPGLDFETRISCKTNAAEQLVRELGRPGYRCRGITLGANTDPYQPAERQQGITRQLLEVLAECRHPVSIITRGTLITRDLDILADMARQNLCSVGISLTTRDPELKRRMEPRAPSFVARLDTIQQLSEAGLPVTLMFAPVIPGLNDNDLEAIVSAAAKAGATRGVCMLLRLPGEVRELFHAWLDTHYPLRADKVRSLLRQSRGGADNDSRFGVRMTGEGPVAELLQRRFGLACGRSGLLTGERSPLRTDLFRPPRDDAAQLGLFD